MHRFSGTIVSNKQVPKLDPLAVVRGSFFADSVLLTF